MTINLVVRTEDIGKRLDKFLQEYCPDFSRSQIQKAIKDGTITLNEKKVAVHHFLKAGDVVQGTLAVIAPLACTPNASLEIPIIAETKEYMVINKPSGVIVHQADGHREPDAITNWAVAHDPAIAAIGDDPVRPGIVHRLDQDVSGCMVIAKTPASFLHLKSAFQAGSIEKKYTALVYGVLVNRGGTLNFPIARSTTHDGRMAARPKTGESRMMNNELRTDEKDAVTEYTVLKQYQQYALVEARPRTGRTHQIRVHFHALGHPIVGDPLYQPKEKRKPIIDRVFLHATQLSFQDLHGTRQTYTSPIPKQLQQILDTIK
ncbi:RluA family pseudouridine synthase [Candidatus Uhrbacteria bacterium]|nr:RluA family pseudouridine synthase [Candidatus Uhrbacteria bacterium]